MTPLRIGTRGSPLALWQAHHVRDLLRAQAPDRPVELIEIETVGDQVLGDKSGLDDNAGEIPISP